MIKIKQNFKILEDGRTIRGQILDCKFTGCSERGGNNRTYSVDRNFYIGSSSEPKLNIKCDYILLVWGEDREEDYNVIEYTYSTKWQAKKVMAYINEFTIKEEPKIIRTKEDFKGKLIKLPKNLSRKKFDRIIKKLKRINPTIQEWFFKESWDNIKNNKKYFSSFYDINSRLHFSQCEGVKYFEIDEEGYTRYKDCKEISIKDFLREENILFSSGSFKIYNPKINLSFEEIKPNATDFLVWLLENPMKEIIYYTEGNKRYFKERYNNEKECFERKKITYWEYDWQKHDLNNISDWKDIKKNCISEISQGEKSFVRVSIDTANFNNITVGLRDSFTHYKTIESLDEENYTLKKPFKVKIEIDEKDGDYIATIEKLGIVCWGNNPYELVEEIKKEILDLYDSLVLDLKWELGKEPKRWRKILKKHIKYTKVKYEG